MSGPDFLGAVIGSFLVIFIIAPYAIALWVATRK
jgi:hypothetical protein